MGMPMHILQTLKLQEAPEDVPTGELPRTILLTVDRTLVQQIVPGARVTVVGISSVFSSGNSDRDSKGKDRAVALKQPYIRVVGMEEMKDGSATIVSGRDNETFTKAEELAFMVWSLYSKGLIPERERRYLR